jgi:hypothetical protein
MSLLLEDRASNFNPEFQENSLPAPATMVILLKHSSDRQASAGINSFINITMIMKRLLRAMQALKYERDLKRY